MNKKIYVYLFSTLVPLIFFGISIFCSNFYINYFGYFYPILIIVGILFVVIFGIKYKIKVWNIVLPVIFFTIFMILAWGIFGIIFGPQIWDKNFNEKIKSGEIKPCTPTLENRMGLDC